MSDDAPSARAVAAERRTWLRLPSTAGCVASVDVGDHPQPPHYSTSDLRLPSSAGCVAPGMRTD
uniref:Uncharacterized protein n=1 Tax=Oryza barthii TaxID=65489 RepID=A0A0D3GF58_9ORYZ